LSLTLNTLGRLEILWDGQPVPELTLRKSQALLIYLALNPGRHDRSRLAGLLWGDLPESNARRNLRHALHRLRNALDPDVLDSDRLSAGLDPDAPFQVDALDLAASVAQADRCRQAKDPATAASHLERAAALYQGDFLSNFDLPDCLEFEEWVARRRAQIREQILEALDTLVTHWTRHGAYERALRYAQRLLALEPLWENSHRRMMTLLALTGQRSAAMLQYERCRHLLATELGLEPLEETTALYRTIQRSGLSDSVDEAQPPTHPSTSLPFVGRAEAHAVLLDAWEAARRCAGQLTLVEGEAGVGKTRLLEETLRYAETQGTLTLRGRCYEFGGGLPYQPIADALRGYFRTEQLALSPIWLAQLARLLPGLHQAHPDLPVPQRAADEAARQRLFEAVARLLQSICETTSALCLFLDDLHWADPSTLDLLHYLVRHLEDAPVWLVGTYRPEEVALSHPLTRLRQGLSRDHRVVHLTLKPLSLEAVQALARSLVGEGETTALGEFLYRESEGNPFILIETISDLQEEGALRQEAGQLVWTAPPVTERLPASVQDIILQRVGRLNERSQGLITLAAVVGQRFSAALLEDVAGHDREAVQESLGQWLARHLIVQEKADLQYDFSHDKIRAVLYHRVEPGERRRLHRRVGEALEHQFRDQTDEHVGALAYHWEQAGDATKATEYLVQAGDQARLVYAHQEATGYYRRALALQERLGETGRAARAQTLMKLGLAYHHTFDYQEARRAYAAGFELQQQAGQDRSTAPLPLPPAPHPLRVRWLEPTTLDPAMSPDNHTSCLLMQLFSGLVTQRPELNIMPDVAYAWDVSEDGRRYVFYLRDDVRWSDGVPVTASDFEYAWKRALDPVTRSPSAGFLHDIEGAKAFNQGDGNREAVGVHAADETTLVVRLEEPTGYFLQLLVRPDYFPVPRHVVETHSADWTSPAHRVTNGPFRLEAWQRGQRLVLARNPGYHGQFGGNVERVEMFPLTDWEARLQGYEEETLDVLGITFFPPEQRARARQRYAEESVSYPILETSYLVLDVTRSPLDDWRVRQALALATDRGALSEEATQGATVAATGGLLPHGMPGHSPDLGLPYDPGRARRLLAEAGYPDGRGFPMLDALAFEAVKARTIHLQEQWRDNLGLEITWQTPDWATFLDKFKHQRQHLLYAMWVADYPDPDNFMRVSRAETWPHWRHEGYERLVTEAGRVMDQAQRLKLYRQADEILVTQVPVLPLTYEREHLLIKPWVRHYPRAASRVIFWKDVILEPHK
jgi:ABC-type oligopeptide transport system substrate-binding subunit/DNA-binding SARP family transcriptional activator